MHLQLNCVMVTAALHEFSVHVSLLLLAPSFFYTSLTLPCMLHPWSNTLKVSVPGTYFRKLQMSITTPSLRVRRPGIEWKRAESGTLEKISQK